MIRKMLAVFAAALTLSSCGDATKEKPQLKNGFYNAAIVQSEGKSKANFVLEVQDVEGKQQVYVHNAAERLPMTMAKVNGDSVRFGSPVFNTSISAQFSAEGMKGEFANHDGKDYILPFEAVYAGMEKPARFDVEKAGVLQGDWTVTFNPGKENSRVYLGEFVTDNGVVSGSILTNSGDYRFLEGVVDDQQLKLSAFDGSHIFSLEASLEGDSLKNGSFYSGKSGFRSWSASKGAEEGLLKDPDKITYLRQGYETMGFKLPGVNRDSVSLQDEKYKGKVVVVQLMGTWCPNCMDETAYLSGLYEQYKDQGLEVIGLSFEPQTGSLEKAKAAVNRTITYHKANYDFAIATYDRSVKATDVVPELSGINSYPTAIYVGRDGKVKKIHTGFSGPGTSVYETWVKENNSYIESLLAQ